MSAPPADRVLIADQPVEGLLTEVLTARIAKRSTIEVEYPLTRTFPWQPQRDSNPCLYLERVVS
jgi:hypothetical protein